MQAISSSQTSTLQFVLRLEVRELSMLSSALDVRWDWISRKASAALLPLEL